MPRPVGRLEGRRMLPRSADRPVVVELADVRDVVAVGRRHGGGVLDAQVDLPDRVVVARRDGEGVGAAGNRLSHPGLFQNSVGAVESDEYTL